MTGTSPRPTTRRKLLVFGSAVASPGAVSVAGCAGATDDDAGRKGVEWFENELGRIGYVHGAGETWAIPPGSYRWRSKATSSRRRSGELP